LQNYSSQQAELLRQPALLDHFEKQLAATSDDMRTNPTIVRMRHGIRKIRPLITSQDTQISEKEVEEISTISARSSSKLFVTRGITTQHCPG